MTPDEKILLNLMLSAIGLIPEPVPSSTKSILQCKFRLKVDYVFINFNDDDYLSFNVMGVLLKAEKFDFIMREIFYMN